MYRYLFAMFHTVSHIQHLASQAGSKLAIICLELQKVKQAQHLLQACSSDAVPSPCQDAELS